MRSPIFALLFSVASGAAVKSKTPPGDQVHLDSIAFAGSGCPAGSVQVHLSGPVDSLTLLYESFVAQSGSGRQPVDTRKNCQLNIKLRYPSGWQFAVYRADYRGYADLPEGNEGVCKTTYYFSGSTNQASSAMTLEGPISSNYAKEDLFGQELVWSPCGGEGMLNVNSEVRVQPIDSYKSALMALKGEFRSDLKWQQC